MSVISVLTSPPIPSKVRLQLQKGDKEVVCQSLLGARERVLSVKVDKRVRDGSQGYYILYKFHAGQRKETDVYFYEAKSNQCQKILKKGRETKIPDSKSAHHRTRYCICDYKASYLEVVELLKCFCHERNCERNCNSIMTNVRLWEKYCVILKRNNWLHFQQLRHQDDSKW